MKRKAPRVIVYKGENKLDTESDTIGNRGYAVGFQALVKFVMGKLPQNEIIQDALRTETKLLPEVVIRELLANALVHQDFEKTGMSPMVEVYSDRVEISNPGEPLVPLERLIDGYESRNERLADVMRRTGICEEKGSGIDRTIDAAETFQLPAPDFRVEQERMLVILYGPRPFKQMDREDRLRACYQHCALQWMQRKAMTNQSLRNRFKVSASSVSAIIASALEADRIKLDQCAQGKEVRLLGCPTHPIRNSFQSSWASLTKWSTAAGSALAYNGELALYETDCLALVKNTQPKTWEKYCGSILPIGNSTSLRSWRRSLARASRMPAIRAALAHWVCFAGRGANKCPGQVVAHWHRTFS